MLISDGMHGGPHRATAAGRAPASILPDAGPWTCGRRWNSWGHKARFADLP